MSRLRERKQAQTMAKLEKLGVRDEDDYGLVLPPAGFEVKLPCRDENGMFSGAREWAANFRWLMDNHPCYIDPDDALAGRWMFMMSRMRTGYRLERSNFAFDYSHLEPLFRQYDITPGIGKDAHFAPDYRIGLELGWGGLRKKVEGSLSVHAGDAEAEELLSAELVVIDGVMNWTRRLAAAAVAAGCSEMAANCRAAVSDPPRTFRQVCQWLAIWNMASRTYNRDGAGGQLDELLRPYYEADTRAGALTDEDAEFYVFCLLLNDPHYYQLGGPDASGRDQTSRMSYIILEAADKLKSSCNLTIRVWDGMDRRLYRRGVEVLLRNRLGYPRFSGDRALVAGFMRNGFSAAEARSRIAVGCNWMSMPGLEYTLNDLVKINLVKVLDVALAESEDPASLERNFEGHFKRAVRAAMDGMDFHLAHQYRNEPELMLNLLSHGPIEKGRDVSHGGATYYNMAIDGAGLAVVADSFGAIEEHVSRDKDLTFAEIKRAVTDNFSGKDGERVRSLLQASGRYGAGGTCADAWAVKLTALLNREIAGQRTPKGYLTIPGWFTWADTVRFGKTCGASPNGRRAGEPISHGANPLPGFRKDGALTAMAAAVASVQPGYGNTAPWQLEVDLGLADDEESVEKLMGIMDGHFSLGGTLVNVNVVDARKILEAHADPSKHPDLIVRVTGFTAYFNSLSPEFRDLVVRRLIRQNP